MQKRKIDELISHFNRKVADMDIDRKYKMELLGMITAIGIACEKELSIAPEHKTGLWVWSEADASWCCGACGCVFEEIEWKPEYNYCPNCGSKMKKPMTIPEEIINSVLGYDD